MKERTEVPVEQTWDLSLLFKTEEDYKKSIEFYKQLVEKYAYLFHLKRIDMDKLLIEVDFGRCLDGFK